MENSEVRSISTPISAESVRPWLDDALLTKCFAPDLALAIKALEEKPEYLDRSELFARRVNTAISRSQPVSRWARYREAYSPDLVSMLLKEFPLDARRQFVLDPMCGSGSTQLAAQEMNLVSLGLDVSPYATLLSRVKCDEFSLEELCQLEEWASDLEQDLTDYRTRELDKVDVFLLSYFPENNFFSLREIRNKIDTTFRHDNRLREFAIAGLLSIVEECSNHKKDGNGLARSPSKVRDVKQLFSKKISSMCSDAMLKSQNIAPSFAHTQSAKSMATAIEDFSEATEFKLGAIIFSPPYPNSFDYFESYKLELLFGGFFDLTSIRTARKQLIRSYRQSGKSDPSGLDSLVEPLIKSIQQRIPKKEARTGTKDGRARLLPNLLRGYFLDMQEVIKSAYKSMPSGSRMHIVVDQSAYLGIPVPTDLILGDLAIDEGLEFESLTYCRAARTSSQQAKDYPFLRQFLRESIVTLRQS